MQFAAESQQRVSQWFKLEPPRVCSPIELVARVSFVGGRFRLAAESIRPTQHDRADQAFDRPAVPHETHCKVIQQFGVRGLRSGQAEVVDGLDQSTAEESLPNPIHLYASRHRVVRVSNPVGGLKPAALAFGNGWELRKSIDVKSCAS